MEVFWNLSCVKRIDNHKFKLPSIQRWQYPVYNLKARFNQVWFRCFCFFKNCSISFSAKVNCAFLVYKKQRRNSRNKHFPSPFHESGKRPFHESGKRPFHESGKRPFHESGKLPLHVTFWNQRKVSRVPFWIGLCYPCMEGQLKLHLQSL